MANSNRFFMSSPRFYIDQEKTIDEASDYRHHRDYSGRHSIADLSLTSYRDYDRDRERRSRFNLSYHRSRSRSRSSSRSSNTSGRRTHRSSSRSHRQSSRHKRRHHRSRSSSASSDSLITLSTLSLATPPQFVTPVHEFQKSERGDLALRIGDTVEVKRYVDKNWYKGYNHTTRKKGIFPIAYVKEIEISSTNAIETLSSSSTTSRRRAVSQPRIVSDKLLVEMPKETEKKGSFFYPTDTVIVRNRGNRTTSTGFQEIDQDVILIKPKDTVNHEPRQFIEPTVERDITEIDHGSHHHVIEEDVTVIRPRRAVSQSRIVEEEKIIIPIRRKEISLREIPAYASSGPQIEVDRIRRQSRHRSPHREIVVEKPREVVVERPRIVERPREIDDYSSVGGRSSRSRARSVQPIRLERSPSYSPPRRKEFKALPPAKTITYNEYGAPVFVDTQTFAAPRAMAVPPRPFAQPRMLEQAPVPVLSQQRNHRVYEY